MRKLMATIAIAALAVGTAQAQGKGHDGGNGHANHNQNAAGGGKVNSGGKDHAGGGGNAGQGRGQADNAPRSVQRSGNNPGNGNARMEMPVRAEAPGRSPDMRGNRGDNAARERSEGASEGNWRGVTRDGDRVSRVAWRGYDDDFAGKGLINGCPPGLAKKNNGCMPPGQIKDRDVWRIDRTWWGARAISDLTGYRYYDGSLVRFGPSGAIVGYYPLLGGALAVGNPWPGNYAPVRVDPYCVDYYRLGDDYRYFDNALYRVDPETNLIAGIAGLLTGDTFTVGQPMPQGYSVYNVPYPYRDRYVDGPDRYYRYSDGYVYQVDPTTQLVVAAIQLLS